MATSLSPCRHNYHVANKTNKQHTGRAQLWWRMGILHTSRAVLICSGSAPAGVSAACDRGAFQITLPDMHARQILLHPIHKNVEQKARHIGARRQASPKG
jgi:hypothetical protein